MTNSEFVTVMQFFAEKAAFGHDANLQKIRYCQYEIGAENFMPDFSKYRLDLNEFCLCVSHLDISTNATESAQNRRVYETNFLIIKACEVGNYEQETAIIEQAQLRAEWLWAAMLHYQHCEESQGKKKGKFFENVRIGGNFRQNDLTGLTDNACGVEVQLSFFEDITHQNIVQKYPEWN